MSLVLKRNRGCDTPQCLHLPCVLGRASWLSVPAGDRDGCGWICTLCRAWGSAWHPCDPSQPPRAIGVSPAGHKQELCPSCKCCEAGGAGWQPGQVRSRDVTWGLESHLAFLAGVLSILLLPNNPSCKNQSRTHTCSTAPSELGASLARALGASKTEAVDPSQNFCLKLLGFTLIALPPGVNMFRGS